MANTLKFGNGKFAVKEGSALAYNDENGNFKPLPFTFDRSTSATRVNKEGLIEVVSNNEPRIDFLNDSKGALKLEPSRSNYWTYSEGSDITLNSPLGEFGFYTINNTFLNRAITYVGTINFTFIIKKIDGTIPTITTSSGSGDLIVLVSGSSTAGLAGVLTDIGNGFYKYELTTEANGASVARIHNKSGIDTYVSLIQYEDSSYPTSYIPTQGSAVTRVADVCNGAGNEQVINSTEGVLFAEISALEDSPTGYLSLSNSSSTQVRLGFLFGNLYTQIRIDNNVLYSYSENGILTQNNKLAIFWNNNTQKFFVNGFLVDTDALDTTISANTLNKLSFDVGTGGGPFHGKVKDVRVYNQALTDQELINLTKI